MNKRKPLQLMTHASPNHKLHELSPSELSTPVGRQPRFSLNPELVSQQSVSRTQEEPNCMIKEEVEVTNEEDVKESINRAGQLRASGNRKEILSKNSKNEVFYYNGQSEEDMREAEYLQEEFEKEEHKQIEKQPQKGRMARLKERVLQQKNQKLLIRLRKENQRLEALYGTEPEVKGRNMTNMSQDNMKNFIRLRDQEESVNKNFINIKGIHGSHANTLVNKSYDFEERREVSLQQKLKAGRKSTLAYSIRRSQIEEDFITYNQELSSQIGRHSSLDASAVTPGTLTIDRMSKGESEIESEFHLPAIRGSVMEKQNLHLYKNEKEPSLEEFLRISAQNELKNQSNQIIPATMQDRLLARLMQKPDRRIFKNRIFTKQESSNSKRRVPPQEPQIPEKNILQLNIKGKEMKSEVKLREASTETNSVKKKRLSNNPSKASPLVSSQNNRKNMQTTQRLNSDLNCYQDSFQNKQPKIKKIERYILRTKQTPSPPAPDFVITSSRVKRTEVEIQELRRSQVVQSRLYPAKLDSSKNLILNSKMKSPRMIYPSPRNWSRILNSKNVAERIAQIPIHQNESSSAGEKRKSPREISSRSQKSSSVQQAQIQDKVLKEMKVVLQKPVVKITEGQSEDESSVTTKKSVMNQKEKRASISIVAQKDTIRIQENESAQDLVNCGEPWSRKNIHFPSQEQILEQQRMMRRNEGPSPPAEINKLSNSIAVASKIYKGADKQKLGNSSFKLKRNSATPFQRRENKLKERETSPLRYHEVMKQLREINIETDNQLMPLEQFLLKHKNSPTVAHNFRISSIESQPRERKEHRESQESLEIPEEDFDSPTPKLVNSIGVGTTGGTWSEEQISEEQISENENELKEVTEVLREEQTQEENVELPLMTIKMIENAKIRRNSESKDQQGFVFNLPESLRKPEDVKRSWDSSLSFKEILKQENAKIMQKYTKKTQQNQEMLRRKVVPPKKSPKQRFLAVRSLKKYPIR